MEQLKRGFLILSPRRTAYILLRRKTVNQREFSNMLTRLGSPRKNEQVEESTLTALGSNVFVAAQEIQAWPEVAAIAAPLAELYVQSGDVDTAFIVLTEGRAAAFYAGSFVESEALLEQGSRLFLDHEGLNTGQLRALISSVGDWGTPALESLLTRLAETDGENEEVVNLGLVFLRFSDLRDGRTRLDLAQQLLEIAGDDERVSDLIFGEIGYALSLLQATGDGQQVLDEGVREGWCRYLSQNFVVMAGGRESLFPARAVERGEGGAVTQMELIVPASGGRVEIRSRAHQYQGEGASRGIFASASQNSVRRLEGRPACVSNGQARSIELLEVFGIVSEQLTSSSSARFQVRVHRF